MIYSLEQNFYYYNLNSKIKYKWYNSKIFSYKIYKQLNQIRILKCKIINKGGWRLSYFGDKYFIKNKIENFSHQEYNNNYTDLDKIQNKILNQIDLYDRNDTDILKIPIKENNYLPPKYDIYLTKFILY
jgi:hypothetical protein